MREIGRNGIVIRISATSVLNGISLLYEGYFVSSLKLHQPIYRRFASNLLSPSRFKNGNSCKIKKRPR